MLYYGNVPSLTWHVSALVPFCWLFLLFFLFRLHSWIACVRVGRIGFHMPRSPPESGWFHKPIVPHWLVDAIIQFEYLWKTTITPERERIAGVVCAGREHFRYPDMSVVYILLCWKMWVKCDVIFSPPPPPNPFMTPLLSLLMWLLLICILYK